MDARQYADEVLHKKALKSKKWLMALIGLGCVMFAFVAGLVVICIRPGDGVPTAVVGLVGHVVTFLGALVGAYTTGQSFVDWKAQSSLAVMASSEIKQSTTEFIDKHIDVSSRQKEAGYEIE